MTRSSKENFMLFSGTSHPCLAEEIAKNLGVKLGLSQIEAFSDGEIGIQILESVRGRDVFVVQSASKNPNYYLMELLIFVDALKRASARSITAVLPYFAYSRQDRKGMGRSPITARLVANLLETAGVDHILTMDLHSEQIQGFFDIPVDNLYSRIAMLEVLKKGSYDVVVTPDVGRIKLAKAYATHIEAGIAIIDKKRIEPASVSSEALIGSVQGKSVLIVDDLTSTGATVIEATKLVRSLGAEKVSVIVTHFLADSALFEGCSIDCFYITNTISFDPGKILPNFMVVSVATCFAEAIRSILEDRSISLFNEL